MRRRGRARRASLRPPQGWPTVAWELLIVVAGVLIALGAQQLVSDWADRRQAGRATEALRDELATHYMWSVEWRVVEPCIRAQIDRLAGRVMSSGSRLNPAPSYTEPGFDFFVLRMPSRNYQDGVWRSALVDGATGDLPAHVRNELTFHYRQVSALETMTAQNDADYQRLYSLSRPLELDPAVRASLLQQLDGLRGRAELMSFFSGQLLRHIEVVGMVPDREGVARRQRAGGTYRFCRARGFPTRSLKDAMVSVDT